MEEPPTGVERHSVGAAHRRSLGRSSRGVPIIPNLPPSLSAMGALWRDEGNPGGTEELRRKTNAVCGDTVDAGKSRDYLPGCRTFGASLSDMSVTLKTSSECFTLHAASFC